MTHINVPQGECSNDQGSGSSVSPIKAVEDESTAGVIT